MDISLARSAVLSDCELHRYRLDREVCCKYPGSIVFAYFGINPSTADALRNDPTVDKWTGFTQRFGGHKFIAGNVFSFRTKDVKELDAANRSHVQVIGPDWLSHIVQIVSEADVLVPCWGNLSKVDRNLRPCFGELLSILRDSGKPVMCFGTNAGGDPKHPLFLPYSTELVPYA